MLAKLVGDAQIQLHSEFFALAGLDAESWRQSM